MQLAEAEAALRIHKSDLEIRPIWHHTQERVEAHILVCFLAYVMWKRRLSWPWQPRSTAACGRTTGPPRLVRLGNVPESAGAPYYSLLAIQCG